MILLVFLLICINSEDEALFLETLLRVEDLLDERRLFYIILTRVLDHVDLNAVGKAKVLDDSSPLTLSACSLVHVQILRRYVLSAALIPVQFC